MKRYRASAARSLLATALGTMTAGSALAAEQVLMPYACRVRGGEVHLVPSADTFYRIYGVRDKQVYTACSPDNPNRCRNWLVHRFDLDCGGTRVGWMKVAEAAARAERLGAWVDAGRMGLAMSPYWTVEREGPVYGRGWWRRSRFDGPYGEHDFIPRNHGGGVIVLPPGYAPVLSTGARFFEAPKLETARAAPPPEPLPPPVKKPEVAHATPPAQAPAKEVDLATAGARAGESTTSSARSSSQGSSAGAPAAVVNSPGGTVTATIINKPGTTATVATPPLANSTQQTPSGTDQIATGSLQNATPSSGGTETAIVGAAAAALLLTASLFFWSRRGRARVVDLARDPARVSLGGLGRTGSLMPLGPLPPMPAVVRDATEERAMPTTAAEALAVIGASSGASPDVLKKIVDGLRQSWHPDLAHSEADRLSREQRMAQINVAWDILSGRQSPA